MNIYIYFITFMNIFIYYIIFMVYVKTV